MKEKKNNRLFIAGSITAFLVGAILILSTLGGDSEAEALTPSFVTTAGTDVVTSVASTESYQTTTAVTVNVDVTGSNGTYTTFNVGAAATTAGETTTFSSDYTAGSVTTTYGTTGTTRSATTTTGTTGTTGTTATTTAATTTTATTTTATQTEEEEAEEYIENAALFDSGFLSYMFDPDGNYYYTNEDPWQRAFGFNELYDVGAAFCVMYYDTMRLYFEYDDKDWLIQYWKGQYGWVFIGSEIGVYNKPTSRILEHYDSANDEDALKMSLVCYRNGEEIFTRGYGTYWWITGFVPGMLDSFTDRSEITMESRITMKDTTMLAAVRAALDENIADGVTVEYTVDGLDLYITYY